GLARRIRAGLLHRLNTDRDHLLARRPWASLLRERAQSRLSGRVRDALYPCADRDCRDPDRGHCLHPGRSAHRLRDAGGVSVDDRTSVPVATQTAPTPPDLLAPKQGRFALSPLNRRRWENFKSNRRGYVSLWLFLFLFAVSLCAELIANNKPYILKFEGQFFFPMLRTYSETTFGGEFETAADYRDPYLQKLIADSGGWMIWPPIRYSYNTHNLDLPTPAPSNPTWLLTEEECAAVVQRKGLSGCRDIEYNWLGTDDQGFDVVARLIYGFRISVLFGLILTSISSVIGVAAGAVQGYFGGWVDLIF